MGKMYEIKGFFKRKFFNFHGLNTKPNEKIESVTDIYNKQELCK